MDVIDCTEFIENELLLTTRLGAQFHFRLNNIVRNDDGTYLQVTFLSVTSRVHSISEQTHGAIIVADLPGVGISDIKKVGDILPYGGTRIETGYLGNIKVEGDIYPFVVQTVEVV